MRKFLLLGVFFIIAMTVSAPRVFGATVYSQLYAGADVMVGTTSIPYYLFQATSTSNRSVSSNLLPITLSGDPNRLMIPMPDVGYCPFFGSIGAFFDEIGNSLGSPNAFISSTATTCTYSFSAGAFPSATEQVSSWTVFTGATTTDLKGSQANLGAIYNRSQCGANCYGFYRWGSPAFQLCDTSCDEVFIDSDPDVDHRSYFTSISVATSTRTVIVTGLIYQEDIDSGIHLDLNVSTPIFSQWYYNDVTATTSGVFSYTWTYTNFSTSSLNFFTFDSTLYIPSTDVFSGTSTPTIIDEISTTTNALGYTDLPDPDDIQVGVGESCIYQTGFSFIPHLNISDCVSWLLWPSPTQSQANLERIKTGFLTHFPLGYITRVVTLLTSSSTYALPELAITLPSGTEVAGQTFTLTPWNYIMGSSSPLGTATSSDGVTLRQATETYWNYLWYILLAMAILHDVIGFGRSTIHNKNKHT